MTLFLGRPSLEAPVSQSCTSDQFDEEHYRRLCAEIGQAPVNHRKQWEYVYTLRVLEHLGFLREGKTCLGFGCGKEPIPAVMAKYGTAITATDIPPAAGVDSHWGATSAEDLFYPGICSKEEFLQRVQFRYADMNDIQSDLVGFDVVWSCCSLEHLGSLRAGMDFVLNSIKCLKPGGVAIHTTEFNTSNDHETFEDENLVLYRRCDLANLSSEIIGSGHKILPLNFFTGDKELDQYIDLPPYKQEVHLKLRIASFDVTSIGLVVMRSA